MDIHKRVKKLVVEKTGDSWTVQVGKKRAEIPSKTLKNK